MTGPDDELLPDGVPSFEDPAHDEVRGLLADLGDVGPMPADVVARLDDVLAGLGSPASTGGETVVPLRRRSRTGPRLLAAAAAVVVVAAGGVGLAQVGQHSRGSDDSAPSSAAGGAEARATAPTVPAPKV